METGGHAPGVGERRVGQNAPERRAKVGVTAKFAGGGKANQDRQNNKRRRAAHIQNNVDSVARVDPAVGFHHAEQAHQQTGGYDSRNNGYKDV